MSVYKICYFLSLIIHLIIYIKHNQKINKMSSTNPHAPEPQPIPFSNQPIEEYPIPPSMDRFPSTSEFNEPLQHNYSIASFNYGEEQQNQQQQNGQQVKKIQKQQDEQVQQLQKVRTGNNQIDQDEILRMFRQEEQKKSGKKDDFTNEKKRSSAGQVNMGRGDKKTASSQLSYKRQQAHDDSLASRKRQAPEDSLTTLHRATSFKETGKATQQSNTQYSLILSSQQIRDLVLQYKIQYRSSVFDPDWQKQRYKLRQQFFEQLCVGIEEMKQKVQLSLSEQQVLDKVREIKDSAPKQSYHFGIFKYCRNIVLQTDIELFIHFHQRSKQPLSKDYKAQYKFLITNLKDPQNYELRRKLLTHELSVQNIKVANEIEFFTDAKRNQIREKEEKLLKEFSVDRQSIMLKPQFEQEKQQQRLSEHIKYDSSGMADRKGSHALNEPASQGKIISQRSQNDIQNIQQPFSITNLLSYNKYLDESTLTQLDQLLSGEQIQKMRRRLAEDLRGQCRERLLGQFQAQFAV